LSTNKFEVYEYMQPLIALGNGEFITSEITLAKSDTPSPFEMSQHTLWCSIPGGYWDYTKPWTKKALDMIIGIQMDLDAGQELSKGMNWHRCAECSKWTNAYYSRCKSCFDDDYEEWEG
jgi:hypothetical protein